MPERPDEGETLRELIRQRAQFQTTLEKARDLQAQDLRKYRAGRASERRFEEKVGTYYARTV